MWSEGYVVKNNAGGKNMVTILVTGVAGFIGSHVGEVLLRMGYAVVGLDSFNDFYDPKIKRRNVMELQNIAKITGSKFHLIEGDIRSFDLLLHLFHTIKLDTVIHLAAYAGVRQSIENPQLYTEVNINGTINILECMQKYGVKRLCFASSSSVYGNNTNVPFSESDQVDKAISLYAATKKAGEVLCHVYHHLYDINVACLRFFTVYGPRQRPDLAIHKFTRLICEGKEIPLYGDGSMRRDYTYIDDIVDGVLRALEWTDSAEKRYDIFNLGEGHTISLTELVNALSRVTRKMVIIKHLPMQPGDVQITYADISHASEVLGYYPYSGFEEGLHKFWDWYQQANGLEKYKDLELFANIRETGKELAL
jgi:UDP-glucuronate 4-epimerase